MSFVIQPGLIQPPLTAGGIAYATGSQAKISSVGTAGQYLVSAGSSAPTWVTPASPPIRTDFSKYDNTVTTASSIGNGVAGIVCVPLTATTELVVFFGTSSAHAVVWDNTAKSFGTPTLIRTVAFGSQTDLAAIALSSTSVLVCSLPSGTTSLETVVLTISGSTISVGTAVATTLGSVSGFITGNIANNGNGRLLQVGSSYVLSYYDGTINPCFRAITVSGTTPTVGAELALTSTGTSFQTYTPFAYSASILLSLSVGATSVFAVPISVSGTTLTRGTQATKAITSTFITAGVLSSGNIALSYYNTNLFAAVVSVSGTTATISSVDTGIVPGGTDEAYMQIFGSQAFLVNAGNLGIGASQLTVLTDTAGTVSIGSVLNNPDGSGVAWVLIGCDSSKIYCQRSNGQSFSVFGISGANPVLRSRPATSTTVSVTNVLTAPFNAYANRGYANIENCLNLRTSSFRLAPLLNSANALTVTFDGVNPASYEQNISLPATNTRSSLNLFSGWLGYQTSAVATTNFFRRVELS